MHGDSTPRNATGRRFRIKILLLVATLLSLSLAGQLLSRTSGASPAPTTSLDFASPSGAPVSLTGKLDRGAVLMGGDGLVKMELILSAEEAVTSSRRVPTDFLVVLDRSGSMEGEKIYQARVAVRELISQLSADDRFALVTYSSRTTVPIPLTMASEASRYRWRQLVAEITPGGGTNMSSGLDRALALTAKSRDGGQRATRILLLSDGLANEGDASVAGLSRRSRTAATREAVLSTIGVGHDFNEYLMSTLADAGTGNYYYLEHVEQLAEVFAGELSATQETIASALTVTIEPGDGVRVIDAAGYPLETVGGKTVFRPGSLFAGQERRIWVTLAVPSQETGDRTLGTFAATYKHEGVERAVFLDARPTVTCVVEDDEYMKSFDKETWARAVAEEDYNRMQQKVAGYVKAGQRDAALEEISTFRQENQRLNVKLRQREISEKLETLQQLESEVSDAFEGRDQAMKRNLLSKQRQSAAIDARRKGGKKLAPAPSSSGGGS